MTTGLPEGWDTIRVGDYFHSWGGMTPSTSNASYWGGNVPWVSSKDIKAWRLTGGEDFITRKALQETRLRLCPVGSVLVVVRSGILAHTLPIAVADAPVSINQDLKAFYCTNSDMNEWLALALRALAPEILTNNRKDGTTVQSVRYEELCDLIIPVPPSTEQRRITAQLAEMLQKVRDTRERLSRVPAILKRFRQAVLAAACSGRLTEEWRLSRTTLSKNSNRVASEGWSDEALPAGWSLATVGEIGSVQGGKRLPKGTPYAAKPTAHPYIRVTDFRDMSIASEDLRYIDESAHRVIKRYTISDSDVYISIAGTIGKVGLVPEHLRNANLTENAAKITGLQNLRKEYLSYALNSKTAQEQIEEFITSSGQPKLALFRIEKLIFPLPTLEEQDEIIDKVRKFFLLADVVEQRLDTASLFASKLTESILAKAFRGELVLTEAELARREGRDYEPASVLLERIRAERANQAKSPQVSKRKLKKSTALVGA